MSDITCTNVNLWYGKNQALNEVSFTIQENTICGLLGRNGAGKTSLMSLLASFRRQSSGSILYGNEPVFDNPLVMPDVAFIYHHNPDSNSAKVRDYLKGHAEFRPHWDHEYALRLLREFDINEKKAISSLSAGQQASVYAITGLASRCPVTLYDEAYLGMDAAVRKHFIQELLDDYLRVPRTILFSTHFIGEIEDVLEDVLVLSEGTVLLHEKCDILRSRGVTVTGAVQAVDRFTASLGVEVLSTRQLGTQKELVLYGDLTAEQRQQASATGLTLSHPTLQDLFVHITENDARALQGTVAA